MNIKQYHFDGDIEVVNLGDVHRGDNNCNEALFNKVVEYIFDNDNTYWLSTGDLLNVATKSSITGTYHSLNLEEELDLFCKEIELISNKCLGIVGSNHHHRLEKETGMNLDKLLCNKASIPYVGESGVINITCGKLSYYVAMHHGVGSGRTRGSKSNNLERLDQIYPGADLYLEGHTHTFDYFINMHNYVDKKRNRITNMLSHYCTTGHFLNWDASYAERQKLKPAAQGAALIQLKTGYNGRHEAKNIKCSLFN